MATLDGAFVVRVAHDLFDHFVEIEILPLEGCIGAVQPRQFENLADETVETLDLTFQAVQLALQIAARMTRESKGDAHSRQWRTQFVRDVAQQLRDGIAVGTQLIRHGVEVACQHR